MPIKIGEVEALFRYPVKSMGGEPLELADLGWHGLDGDRRLALRRLDDRSGFPWLTASKLPELAEEIGPRHGSAVEMVHVNRGIFDEASVSLITSTTVGEVGRLAAHHPDVRRFRPNILIASSRPVPFEEDAWVGGVLAFGDAEDAPAVYVTNRDERCAMVNFDPDSAHADPEVLKTIVRVRDNKAGVYGAVAGRGRLAVGQSVYFEPAAARRGRP
ncbi:MAG TPA: MOSC domain-containing protein [Candidatus Polarisedimenticolaceae bacterium]